MLTATFPDSIVVTATRQAESVRQTGRRITVWTAHDLAALPVSSFDELLRSVGGVEVQSRGGFGVQSDLTMRGSTFNGVLVLLDGVRLNDPMTGHFLSDFPVPLSEIARMEVLRGPAAALYGPDALGGVIQLFTFTGLQQEAPAQPYLNGSAEVQTGSFGLYDLDGAGRRVGRRTTLSAASAWQTSDGMPIRDEAGTILQSSQGEVRTDFERQAHTLALTHAFGSARLYARAGLDDRDFGAFQFYPGFASDPAREATATYWMQLRLSNQAQAPTRWQVHLAAKQHEDTYFFNPQTPANEHTSRLVQAQAHVAHLLSPQITVTGGTSAALRAIDSNNLGTHDDGSAGAFGMVRWQPAARLTVNTSGRLDYDPGYGWEATPQLYAAYTRSVWTLRAGVGRAVRAPNYVERYLNTALARPRGRNLGNPDLRPEQAWTYETGVDLYPYDGFSLHATLFHRRTNDLIDYAMLTPADTVWLARNLHRVKTHGLELDAEAVRTLSTGQVRLTATYTWLDANLGAVPEENVFKYALTNARHLIQAHAAFDVHALSFGTQVLWKDRLQGPSYGIVNVRAGYRPDLGRQRIGVFGEIRNLFDADYAEIFDAPMPGRWWLFGLRLVR